jgi:acyl-CoA synthetase (AMP-forming)/AMP-acid ligase II
MRLSFGRLMRQHCLRHADTLALVNVERNRRYSFREYHQLTNRIANAMRTTLGLGRGDTAAFILKNDSLSLLHYLTVLKQEATCAYTNYRDSLEEHLRQVDHIAAKAVFLEAASLDAYYEALRSRGCTIVVMDPPARPHEGVVSFWDAVDAASDAETGVEMDDREHVAVLRFTGGTTGRGKCVMYTPDNLMCTHESFLAYGRDPDFRPGLRYLHMLPLSHAVIVAFAVALLAGGTNYTLNAADLEAWCRTIETERITHTAAVPTILYRLLELPAAQQADLSSLRYIGYGAAPISPAKLGALVARFGAIFTQVYSASENFTAVTSLGKAEHVAGVGGDAERRLASTGRPGLGTEVRICDDQGNEVPPGTPGEVWLRSRATVRGYYRNPEATAAEFQDGFWKSGDIGILDRDGYLTIVDRRKDMIVTGGFNVYAGEVENALTSHPAVLMAAVVGIPHPEWGEAVHAEVVLREAAGLGESELIAHARSSLSAHKLPKSIAFVPQLPLSPAGKIVRRLVKEKYWKGAARGVA